MSLPHRGLAWLRGRLPAVSALAPVRLYSLVAAAVALLLIQLLVYGSRPYSQGVFVRSPSPLTTGLDVETVQRERLDVNAVEQSTERSINGMGVDGKIVDGTVEQEMHSAPPTATVWWTADGAYRESASRDDRSSPSSNLTADTLADMKRSNSPSERFLFGVPVNGPNNQYYAVVSYLKLAMILNRTLVLPAFVDHSSHRHQGGSHWEPFAFESTFDVASLSRASCAPRLISTNSFLSTVWTADAPRLIGAMWHSHKKYEANFESDPYWSYYRDKFFRPKAPVPHIVPSRGTAARLDWTLSGIGKAFGGDRPEWELLVVNHALHNDINYYVLGATVQHVGLPFRDAHLRVVRALVHAPAIVRHATDIINAVIGSGEPFFAVHWRRADYAIPPAGCTTYLRCTDAESIDNLIDVLDSAVSAAVGAGFNNATHWPVFLSAQRFSADEASVFASRGYTKIARYPPPVTDRFEEPYYISLAEQETGMRATGFVGSYSTWSERIIETRVANAQMRFTWHMPTALKYRPTNDSRTAGANSNGTLVGFKGSAVACGFEYMALSNEAPRRMSLACGEGKVVSRAAFASFGRPAGLCGAFVEDRGCHCPHSVAHVEKLCVGRPRCEIPVDNAAEHFAYSCNHLGGYSLAVVLECRATL
eukprot:Opistho-2@60782